ncbi:MAG: glycosyltransferase family 1 protein [Coprococcus sp.]
MLKKVLVFGMTDNPGGMESCIMNYYRHVDKNKIHFDFLCNWESMVCEKEVKANGSKVYTIPQKSRNYKAYKRAMNTFFSEHADEYDVFWYNTCTLTNIDYLIYAKRYGIKKRIIHAHNSGNETSMIRGILHYVNKIRLGRYATDFWSCSMAAAVYFFIKKQIHSQKYRLINNAISTYNYKYDILIRNEVRKNLGLEDKYVIGHVGRFQFQKNHEFLIDIFYEYLKLDSRAVLMLVGQGEEEDAIRQKVINLGIEKSVLYMGVRTDVNRLLQAMDVFLLPSRFEGLPLVLIEAQTSGLRCLTTKNKVPYEVNVTGNVEFEELKENSIEWAHHIECMEKQPYDRKSCLDLITDAGYDILKEAEKMESYMCEE